MSPIEVEAAVLRAGILVGLVHEREAGAWAEARLAANSGPADLLTDVILAPVELTAVREALRPLCAGADTTIVVRRLLELLLASSDRPLESRLKSLTLLDRELGLPSPLGAQVKGIADRMMLVNVGMRGERAPDDAELEAAVRAALVRLGPGIR
jgi:hypothetical protein